MDNQRPQRRDKMVHTDRDIIMKPYDFYRWSGEVSESFSMTCDVLQALNNPQFQTEKLNESIEGMRSVMLEVLSRPGILDQQRLSPAEVLEKCERMILRLTPEIGDKLERQRPHIIHLGLVRICATYELFLKYTLLFILFNCKNALGAVPSNLKIRTDYLKNTSGDLIEILKREDPQDLYRVNEVIVPLRKRWLMLPKVIPLTQIEMPTSNLGRLLVDFCIMRSIFDKSRGIISQMKTLEAHFKIDVETVFSFESAGPLTKEKLQGVHGSAVADIFNLRHEYVHWQKLSIMDLSELEKYRDIIQCLIECLGRSVAQHFKLKIGIAGFGSFEI